MNWLVWQLIAAAVATLLPFGFRTARAILVDTFRHPRTESVIFRDEMGHVHIEPVDGGRNEVQVLATS